MRVSINNSLSPRPFIGALIQGVTSLAGGIADRYHSKQQQALQMQHDKEMASINQENAIEMAGINQANIEEQMRLQNEYQVEQWNRENSYNDPAAVRARYEAAGLNPRAVFGQGSANGAGIAGGLSSAPSGSSTGSPGSGSSSRILTSTNFAGIGSDIGSAVLQAQQFVQQKKLDKATIDKQNAETSALLIDNLTRAESNLLKLEDARADIALKLTQKDVSEQEISESKKRIAEIDQRIESAKEQISLIRQQVKESESSEQLNKQKVVQSKAETATTNAMRKGLVDKLDADKDLTKAQKKYYKNLAEKVDKEYEYIAKEVENYDINLYAELAKMTSSELRGWFDVLAKFIDLRRSDEYKNSSLEEQNKQDRLLFFKYVLPYLLQIKK